MAKYFTEAKIPNLKTNLNCIQRVRIKKGSKVYVKSFK
jgi:hypothetical protein